jgi:hypothetical protein
MLGLEQCTSIICGLKYSTTLLTYSSTYTYTLWFVFCCGHASYIERELSDMVG